MSFDFEVKQKTKIKISIYDQEFSLSKPTVGQAESLASFADLKDNSEALKRTIEFMELMGLPKDISESMELEHFTALVEFVVSKVKKN
jgi:hypothetical protein